HTQTAGVSLTAQQPLVNIVRTTIEALAGVLGGTQSLHTNSYDEALALPTAEAVQVALRTQQVIAHESGVTNTADPLGGAYFAERLTDEIEAAAYEYFHRIDELGGMVEAIKTGFPQREIADAAFRYQRQVDSGERIVVGVNAYRADEDSELAIHRPDPEAERRQKDRLATTRSQRDQGQVDRSLGEITAAAERGENLMAPLIEAARVRTSEGEIVAALQGVWGTYSEHPQF
ncbi:MAG: methylmalonyl-CoA mutase family protein, partial [Solirubrobacterales bacterium]